MSDAGAHRAPDRKPRPNVLLIVSDDQRADTIRALGNDLIETPHLDGLVRAGAVFRRAICPNPICVASRAEMLSGCCGLRRGGLNLQGRFAADQMLWPQVMRQAGYETCYVGKWHTAGRPSDCGYGQSRGLFAGGGPAAPVGVDALGREVTGYVGWVFQEDDGQAHAERGVGLTANISATFADAAIEFLRAPREAPFFLHVNFTAPHDPLLMPPGWAGKYDERRMPVPANFLPEHPFDHGNARGRDERLFAWPRTPAEVRRETALYYAVISHMDREIGRLLQALADCGQDKNTLVIFTSDHGVALGSHGLRGKQNMYEHTIGVPLVIRVPDGPQDVRYDAPCYLRDLYPTVCELAGLEVPRSVEGRSLAPVLRGEKEKVYQELYGYYTDAQQMIRTDRWKLIHYPKIDRWQLFDLEHDPLERHDLAASPDAQAVVADLRGKLAAWQREVGDGRSPR